MNRLRATSIGFIFQTFNLVPTLSAAENVEAALIPLGPGHADRHRRVAAALESVGPGRPVPAPARRDVRRAAAAGRDRPGPGEGAQGLLADEPTGNLDEDTRDEIITLLERLWRERGLTLVLVTHDTAIARRAQRVGVMGKGRFSIRRDTRRPSEAGR